MSTPNRRGFLALAGLGLLSACTTAPVSRKGAGTAEAVDKLAQLLPKHIPYAGVTPDVNTPVSIGFTKYPDTLVKAITEVPGKGSSFTAMTPLWGPPPPTPNAYNDAVNKALGATVKLNIVDGNSYGDKLAPMLAAGNVPEITAVPGWILQTLSDFDRTIDKLFTDLGPYLSGDKSAAYPMLANISEEAWAFGVFNGKLMSVPHPGMSPVKVTYYRQDILAKLGAQPWKTADELFELARKITDPKKKRWAFGGIQQEIERAFRAPRDWRLDGGKLVHRYETKEYADAVAFQRKIYEAELVHPTIVSQGITAPAGKELFEAGQAVIAEDGFGAWHEAVQRQATINPEFAMAPIYWTADGGAPFGWYQEPAWMYLFLRKDLPKEKVEEILRILNWFGSPIGTEEYHLWRYGVEGTHYTQKAGEFPVYTKKGQQEAQPPTFFFLSSQLEPDSEYYPGYLKESGEYKLNWYNSREKYPFEGIRKQDPSKLAAAQQPTEDKVKDIVKGRRPLTDLAQVVEEWKTAGGEEARAFFMKVLKDNGRV
ncbi:extracellular solute-binding protein [Nonomuraea sp. NPDC050556]|uniref:extracellular solute-binding protein n=1 Tax=Nonomuraea sp. NPDC050556 TaxID=3364369 RepID=UPI0037878F1E